MKTTDKIIIFLAFMIAFNGRWAAAENIQARVVSVDQGSRTVTVEPAGSANTGGAGAQGGRFTLAFTDATQFSGIDSFENLEAGDLIDVDASQGARGTADWQVNSLSLGTGSAATGNTALNSPASTSTTGGFGAGATASTNSSGNAGVNTQTAGTSGGLTAGSGLSTTSGTSGSASAGSGTGTASSGSAGI